MPNRAVEQISEDAPDVTFAIACFNAQPFLGQAVESALAQTGVSVEVIIVDDGSTDGSFNEAQELALKDSRVRVFKTPKNGGPSAARNVVLDEMRGTWFAVLDSDDILQVDRTKTLIDTANKTAADLIADNLMVFGEGISTHVFYSETFFEEGYWLDIQRYIRNSQLFSHLPAPGFLKPMIRASVIKQFSVRYNHNLRIGEDDELIVRLLNKGCRYYLHSKAMYMYRKHPNSISHRLSVANAERLVASEISVRQDLSPEFVTSAAYKARFAALMNGLAFVKSVDFLKKRQFGKAVSAILAHPKAALLYRMPIMAAVGRILNRK
jgi:succinoglycan biosynthesis protein ExoO